MLKQRIITAVFIVATVAAALFVLPPLVAGLLFAALWVFAAWEWSGFGQWSAPMRLAYASLVAAGLAVCHLGISKYVSLNALMAISLFWWVLALFWILRYPTPIFRWQVAVAGFVALIPAWVAVQQLYLGVSGPWLVIGLLLIVWGADVGAYFAGRFLGRRKLAPQVSPKKTWEGVAGGLALAVFVSAALALLLEFDVAKVVAIGAVAGMVSIVGDLTVSMFKRNANLKDSGGMLPGHGGLLDRIDSLTAAAPVFFAGLTYWGVVQV